MTVKRVLVDTSAWIEYLRNSKHPVSGKIEFLMENDEVCVASVVRAELIRGAASERERKDIDAYWRELPLLESDDALWEEAGDLAFRLRRKGITPGLIDCYLAALALRHQARILSLDKGFESIQQHASLTLEAL